MDPYLVIYKANVDFVRFMLLLSTMTRIMSFVLRQIFVSVIHLSLMTRYVRQELPAWSFTNSFSSAG